MFEYRRVFSLFIYLVLGGFVRRSKNIVINRWDLQNTSAVAHVPVIVDYIFSLVYQY